MPRKPLDKRLLRLATEATITVKAHASLEPFPSPEMQVQVTGNLARPEPYPDLVWSWCDVTVHAEYAGTMAEVTVRGLSYRNERAYRAGGQYTQDLAKVLTKLLASLDAAAEAVAGL